jgi:hypothetical protein
MSNTQLIASLSLYILSVVAALVLTIAYKKGGALQSRVLLSVHLLLFLVFLIFYLNGSRTIYIHYLFLLFFCSGILLSGLMIRSGSSLVLRLYPALYLSSIFFFLLSPSRTIRFITFSWDQSHHEKWNLTSNYYFEEEKTMLSNADSLITYKVTRQYGVFHKTLARDISFGHRLDSIHLLSFNEEKGIRIRGYYIRKSDTFEACDSMDLSVPFVASKNTIIQKR